MKHYNRLALVAGVLATTLGCQGCANFILIDLHDPARVSERLSAGNKVRVSDASGKRRTLEVAEVESDEIVARDRSGAEVHIEYADAPKVERREFAPGKTAALVASIVVGLYLLYLGAEVEAYGSALSGG